MAERMSEERLRHISDASLTHKLPFKWSRELIAELLSERERYDGTRHELFRTQQDLNHALEVNHEATIRAEKAEARIAELEAEARERVTMNIQQRERIEACKARVAKLEAALRVVGGSPMSSHSVRAAALAALEEKP